MIQQQPKFLVVDLFCGAGGTTTGFVQAMQNGNGLAKVIACVNHDPKAIESHWKNHPDVTHFEEDIRKLKLAELMKVVNHWKAIYPDALLVLWASLECTNFSKAKGGQAREADSRTLANDLQRYIRIMKPDYIQIENVVEFMSWGPLDEFGKPVSKKNGEDWIKWRNKLCKMGYRDDWKELNSANYGAFTSRNRLFGVFARPGLPIVWPEPTHAKVPSKMSMHGDLQRWKAVKEVLDFSDQGESIFTRKKSLSDKTLERIFAGLMKFVAKGDKSFISKYYSGKPAGKNISVDGPAGTVTCVDGQALVQPEFLLKYNSTDKKGNHYPPSVDEPCPVITGQNRLGLIQPEFLALNYSGGGQLADINNPCPTLSTKDRVSIVKPEYFIEKCYNTNANIQSIDSPAGTIMPNDKHRLVETVPFIMPTNFDNGPKSTEDPLGTITADRHHHYIVNPSHGGNVSSTDNPCPVIVARQDKAPLYLIQAVEGPIQIPVYDTDSEIMIKIKNFMVVYHLVDIKMRMLRVLELLMIQGFPVDYKLEGNQSDQKKFIGNSVVPQVVKCWVEALGERISPTVIEMYRKQKPSRKKAA